MNYKFAAVLLLFTCTASATIEGTFWDPNFAGEGWTIESQNDLAFFTWYTYNDDGTPTFRTVVCEVEYALQNDALTQTCEGTLFVTRNRTDSEEAGDFSVIFTIDPDDGRPRGQLSANGEDRIIEPFDFNFVNRVDYLHGVWLATEVTQDLITTSVGIVFNDQAGQLQDGRPAREFQTFDGRFGYAYFEETEGRYVVVIENGDGTLVVMRMTGNDDGGPGIGQLLDANFNPLTPINYYQFSTIANTEGEEDIFAQTFADIFSKRARTRAAPMRAIPLR